MTERLGAYVSGSKRPRDGENYTWKRHANPFKRNQTIGWIKVAKGMPEEEFTPPDVPAKPASPMAPTFDWNPNLITPGEQEGED